MAEQPRNLSCSEEQIQSMVRGILGEMLQSEQRQSVQPVVQQFDSVEREINQRFRLPWNNVDNANELRASSSDAVSNATTQSHSTHVSNSMTVSAPCQTGVPFNPMVNYGLQPITRSNKTTTQRFTTSPAVKSTPEESISRR